jgi:hypothetical protein
LRGLIGRQIAYKITAAVFLLQIKLFEQLARLASVRQLQLMVTRTPQRSV